jgi:GNAT superfamily N-acetyltransferase
METIAVDHLPGVLGISRGNSRDYDELARFHYRRGRPATFADVWTVRYSDEGRVVAVGVLSYPVPASHARDGALDLGRLSDRAKLRFVNRHLRTISRVIVHPTFRSLGLARTLVDCLLHNCTTRYVEAFAAMGRAHPFFELAGMTRYEIERPGAPIYYLLDTKSFRGDSRGGKTDPHPSPLPEYRERGPEGRRARDIARIFWGMR